MIEDGLPRVLIISKVRVTELDNSGASIGKWFSRWPRDRVAQLFTGARATGDPLFSNEYQIGAPERRFGGLFYKAKAPALRAVTPKSASDSAAGSSPLSLGRAAYQLLFNSGLWEFVFHPRLSPQLLNWIERFKPEVLYVQPADIGIAHLATKLARHLQIPMVVQMSDDFPQRLYPYRPMTWCVDAIFKRLFRRARFLLGTGPTMQDEYLRRYGLQFLPLMIADSPSRFDEASAKQLANNHKRVIIYSGGLGHFRWEGLVDVHTAMKRLEEEGIHTELHVFTSNAPADLGELLGSSSVVFHKPPLDSEIPSIFKGADMLLLPESFRQESLEKIRLSISTKAHLYMMARRPTLVYGPRGAGVVEYALRDQWAYTLTSRNVEQLSQVMKSALTDSRNGLYGPAATATIERNHSLSAVCGKFESLFRDACSLGCQNSGSRATSLSY